MSIEPYCAELRDSPEPPCTPGISPTPSSPRITRTSTVRVLSLSILSRSFVPNAPSDLVVASPLKSSRTFSPNVTMLFISTSSLMMIQEQKRSNWWRRKISQALHAESLMRLWRVGVHKIPIHIQRTQEYLLPKSPVNSYTSLSIQYIL